MLPAATHSLPSKNLLITSIPYRRKVDMKYRSRLLSISSKYMQACQPLSKSSTSTLSGAECGSATCPKPTSKRGGQTLSRSVRPLLERDADIMKRGQEYSQLGHHRQLRPGWEGPTTQQTF